MCAPGQASFRASQGARTFRWCDDSSIRLARNHLDGAFKVTPNRLQVNVALRVLTRPNADKLPEIYRTLGTDYAERVLPSIIQVWIALDFLGGSKGVGVPG